MGVWDSSTPPDPEHVREAEADSEFLMECFAYDLEEQGWKRYHDPPKSVRGVLREYEERGAPLGDYPGFLPKLVHHILTLRTYGTPSQLQRDLNALDRMEDVLSRHVPIEEHLALDRQWQRLTVLKRKAEYALSELEEAGFAYDPETRLVKNQRSRVGNVIIRKLYWYMIERYHEAWPDDTWNGQPKKNPQRLQEHIRVLLSPFMGWIDRQAVLEAIDNR